MRIRRTTHRERSVGFNPVEVQHGVSAPPSTPPAAAAAVSSAPPVPDNEMLIKSPIVGTFYESSSPGNPPFVRVGETVQPGAGAVHHRIDEADERDRSGSRRRGDEQAGGERPAGRVRGGAVWHPPPLRRSWSPIAAKSPFASSAPARNWASPRWRCIRKRTGEPARPLRRPGDLHRPGQERQELSGYSLGHLRGGDHQRRRHPPRLRIPERERRASPKCARSPASSLSGLLRR